MLSSISKSKRTVTKWFRGSKSRIVIEGQPLEIEAFEAEANQVMPDVSAYPGLQRLIAARVPHGAVLLGTAADLSKYTSFLHADAMEWNWDANVVLPDAAVIIVCSLPQSSQQWHVIRELKQKHGAKITGIQQLVLPFTPILFAQGKLDYYLKTIDEIAPYYLGEKWFGPIDRLDKLFPLAGKRVIEFGPFDGCQSAGLMHHGVSELVCIEARAENYIKSLIAQTVFGWRNIRLVLDDMHNADAVKYGRFDLAFCHGTYYHAISPFVLLENLVSLADNIFLGGFVLQDDASYAILSYEGEQYRVQPYEEYTGHFTAGVNKTSYYFHPQDLTRFFSNRGYQITLMDDESSDLASHRFYRFFATRE